MTPLPPPDVWARAHGFSLEELAANRGGQIHPTQLARYTEEARGAGRVMLILAALAVLVGLALGLYTFSNLFQDHALEGRLDTVLLCPALGLGAGLVAAFFGFTMRRFQQTRLRLAREGKVVVSEGALRKFSTSRQHGGVTQWYQVNGVSAPVSQQGYSLACEGARHRLYTLPGEQPELLSIEPVPGA
jgi:hypothetical protein